MKEIEISERSSRLPGNLAIPLNCSGVVLFAHGSGSSRSSPRNQSVAQLLNEAGLGTLLFDLLTEAESKDPGNVFDIPLLSRRLVAASRWVQRQDRLRAFPLGYFGASTGGGAALWAAAELGHEITAVVLRGGRPDLAIPRLAEVIAPALLIVGGRDEAVIEMNQDALRYLYSGELKVIPGATHLFKEPGALENVACYAEDWFLKHFKASGKQGAAA